MSKALRILLVSLLGLSASVWLGATGMAPVAAVAPAAEAAQATAAAPPAEGSGAGSGSGVGVGGGESVWSDSGGSYLGVDVQDVTKERVAALKLKEERGVEVNMVDQDAPAGKAGLKEHDVILEFNGARVESVEQLRRMIHEMPPGRTVTLGISRDGQPLTLNATLADRGKSYSFAYTGPKVKMPKVVIPRMPEIPDMQGMQIVVAGSTNSGLLVENLTPQLGEFFGAKDGAGVLVRSVEKGSPAEAAGFKAGDIIIRVEQEKVADRGDWRSAMRNHRSGKVSIGIIRDKREQTLSLVLPEAKEQSSVWRSNGQMELDLDLDDLNNELEDMDIEINQLGPQMELLRPQMERLRPGPERIKEMLRLKKELSGQLTASLKQEHGELHQALVLAHPDSIGAVHKMQAETACAVHKARLEAQRALAQQRKQFGKARLMMLHRVEMD
jgi:membrane-associated protease RseP (regulator of RpoE activity)